ncbi:MAG: prolipoprotein diacylglyceryl transferase [Actinobacteria bacterium]|nr:prolipoprotein diacylglyceryl transferase [Actinomycetota bacterium]
MAKRGQKTGTGRDRHGRRTPRNSKDPERPAPSPPLAATRQRARDRWVQKTLREVLRPTFWFDTGTEPGEPYSMTISFSGRRIDARRGGKARPGDRFVAEQVVEGVLPGCGLAAVTAELDGMHSGEWEVTAAPQRRPGDRRTIKPYSEERRDAGHGHGPLWPRRVAPRPGRSERLKTVARPLAAIPGVHQLAWGPMVIAGVFLGIALQALLLSGAGEDAGAALLVSVVGVLGGWVGAKAWYVAVQHGRGFDGWCVQGAILGGAIGIALVLAGGASVPAGPYLDATAPGLLLGMAVGRPGCFLAGCCYGRPTASRWGIWSSDRRLGIRRIPTQLIEALLCLVIGVTAVAVVSVAGLGDSGALLVGALAAYTLGRQMILPLRAEPRQTRFGRPLVIAASLLALVGALLGALL